MSKYRIELFAWSTSVHGYFRKQEASSANVLEIVKLAISSTLFIDVTLKFLFLFQIQTYFFHVVFDYYS